MALRVIAGSAGGIHLDCPRTGSVRPTMDQVRGAVFSSLAASVPEAHVLDLFAGAGGLGIEALSRGAGSVTFVERDRRAMDCIRGNLEKTRLVKKAELVCIDVFTYLGRASAGLPFDFIFADPPYTTADQPVDFPARLLACADLIALLSATGIFVLEKSPINPLPPDLNGWNIIRRKRYGMTEVIFLTRSAS